MSQDREYKPGEFVMREVGLITTSDGEVVKGAIIEFPAGPPEGMTYADVWDGSVFTIARPAPQPEA